MRLNETSCHRESEPGAGASRARIAPVERLEEPRDFLSCKAGPGIRYANLYRAVLYRCDGCLELGCLCFCMAAS